MRKWLVLGLGQKMHKMSLEQIVVSVCKETHTHRNTHTIMSKGMSKGQRDQLIELPMAKPGTI